MKSRATAVDANQARMSRLVILVSAMDTDQCQRPMNRCHAAMDHRQCPLTATDQSHVPMHTDHRQHPVTVVTNTDQRRVGMDTNHPNHPLTTTDQSHAVMHTDHLLTAATDMDQCRAAMDTDHRRVTGIPLGRHPTRQMLKRLSRRADRTSRRPLLVNADLRS